MPHKPSLEEIMAKREFSAHDGVLYRAAKMPKSYSGESRSATFIMTDETKDSYGDIVRAKGVRVDRFLSNPIALLNHNKSQMVGTWDNVRRIAKRVEGTVTLAKEGTADYIDMTASLMEQGILRAASIGFMPIDFEMMMEEDDDGWAGGIDFKECDLTECSIVAVPANPSALAKSIQQGNMLARDFLEEVLDTYTKTGAGLIVEKSVLEEAHKEAHNERSVVSITNNPTLTENFKTPAFVDVDESLLEEEDNLEVVGKTVEQELLELNLIEEIEEAKRKEDETLFKMITRAVSEALGFKEKEPDYVEEGLAEAKALREQLRKELAD